MRVGILALQGDFEAHGKALARLGVEATFIKSPEDVAGLDGVILPGGESTTHLKVLAEEGLLETLRRFAQEGGAFFGTCAGAILLAKEVKNPPQESLGLLDIAIVRNGYGRQLASDVRSGSTKLKTDPLEMVFIRAPIIERVGKGVEVLGECDGRPVMVQQGRILAATFHPELTADPSVHAHFLKLVRMERRPLAGDFPRQRNRQNGGAPAAVLRDRPPNGT